MKKIISFFCVLYFFFSAPIKTYASSYGHTDCLLPGKWYGDKQSSLVFYVYPSVISTQFPQSLFSCVNQWNNITNKVNVSCVFPPPQLSLDGKSRIYNDTTLSSGTYGYTRLFDLYGNNITSSTGSALIDTAGIGLNLTTLSTKPQSVIKKTIRHEVGHALLLNHPVIGLSIPGHTYWGLPFSVMNQNEPNNYDTSGYVTYHDEQELIYKWNYYV